MLDVNRKTGKFDRKVWPNKFPRPLLIYALTLSFLFLFFLSHPTTQPPNHQLLFQLQHQLFSRNYLLLHHSWLSFRRTSSSLAPADSSAKPLLPRSSEASTSPSGSWSAPAPGLPRRSSLTRTRRRAPSLSRVSPVCLFLFWSFVFTLSPPSHIGDASDEAKLTELLKGSDTVMSFLGGMALMFQGVEEIVVKAAKGLCLSLQFPPPPPSPPPPPPPSCFSLPFLPGCRSQALLPL